MTKGLEGHFGTKTLIHLHNGQVKSWTGYQFVGGDPEYKCESRVVPLILSPNILNDPIEPLLYFGPLQIYITKLRFIVSALSLIYTFHFLHAQSLVGSVKFI